MLFGLSMDYEVFLVTRMREAWDDGADNATAVAYGLERTGRIITAAAIIMCAAFSGFVAGRIVGLQQFGLGLAVAILVDATLVRSLLVPSMMRLFDRWNWWLPVWAARLVRVSRLRSNTRVRPTGTCAAAWLDRPERAPSAPSGAASARRSRFEPLRAGQRRCSIGARMKGLICAGGSATRLEELTRVTNKHLLPVGRWPMVYYPLQLLQRVGVHEVLLVTGKQHAGDFIDLLGDGRLRTRSGDEPLFDVDLSYKVQVEPGGIAQVVGMARDFAAGEQARRVPRRQHLRVRPGGRDRRVERTARSSS